MKLKNKKKYKAFILGSYGCGNRGDEAILSTIIHYLEDVCDITVSNGKFDDMKKYFDVKTVRCGLAEGKITFWLILTMLTDSIYQFFRILQVDMLIYGGGSSIHDLTPYNLIYMFFWHWIAKLFRKKVCYVGMGVGPIDTRNGKRLCTRFLKKADLVCVRDKRGFEICKSLGIENVKYSCDLAFFENSKSDIELPILSTNVGGEYITVSACAWFESTNFWKRQDMDFEKKIDDFSACLQSIYDRFNKKLVFVPTFCYDEELGRILEKKFGHEIFICLSKDLSYKEMSDIISGAWLHVGMRMHSIIFALRAGVPIVPFIYDEKLRQLVNRFGLENLTIEMNDMTTNRADFVCKYLEQNREPIIEQITKTKDSLKEISGECLKDVRELLINEE